MFEGIIVRQTRIRTGAGCRWYRSLVIGGVFFAAHGQAAAQTDIRMALRPPHVVTIAPHRDPGHPPPAPGSAPRSAYRPGPARALPQEWGVEVEEEDTRNLIEQWQQRRSPEDFHALAQDALALPAERGPAHPTMPQTGAPVPDAAAGGTWSQIGNGNLHPDKIHHTSGRQRGAAYAWDNGQKSTVLWLGSCSGGLWKAVSLGLFAVFSPVSDNLPGSPSVGAFLVHPGDSSRILIGTGDLYRYPGSGMYKTKDGGATWKLISGYWPSSFQKIIDDYNDSTGNTVVAQGDSGIWRSTNFGDTWTRVYSGSASDLVQDPNFPWLWYAGAPGVGVLRSTDYGKTFAPVGSGISTPIGRVSVAVSASASWAIYALTEGSFGTLGGIWRSDNYGDGTWNSLDSTDHISGGQAFHTCAIGVDPANADRLFVGMAGMQWTENATSSAPSWYRKADADGGHPDYTSFNFQPGTSSVIVTNDGGAYIFDYVSHTVNGMPNELGLNCQQTMQAGNCLAGSRTLPDLCLVGLQDNGMVRIDRNYSPVNLIVGAGDGGAASISPDNPNIVAFSDGVAYDRYFSIDQGTHWSDINFSLPNDWVPTVLIDPTPGRDIPYIYTCSGKWVWNKPIDSSTNWWPVNSTPLPNGFNPESMDESNDPYNYVFYIANRHSGEFYVMDGYSDGSRGEMMWEIRTPPLPSGSLDTECMLAADRSSLRPYTVTYATGGSRPSCAFLSNDRGLTWTNVTGDLATKLPGANYLKLVANPADQTELYLATDVGIYRSDNGGQNWYAFMGGLPAVVSVAGLELNYDGSVPPILHISTSGRGYWDRLIVPDAALSGLSLSLATVMGSRKVTGTIFINKAAPHAITVPLTNTNPAATCPSSVTIPAGATYARFTITTVVVATSKSGYVSAAYNGVTLTQPLTVRPISVGSIALSPNPVIGGSNVAGSVKLEAPAAPGSITVTLSSSNTQVAYPTVASLTIPAGASSATFTVKTRIVHVQTRVSIQTRANGLTKSKLLTVTP